MVTWSFLPFGINEILNLSIAIKRLPLVTKTATVFVVDYFSAQEQGLRLSSSFKCLNSKVDLSSLEAEATLDLWEHQLQRLRNEGSVRTITRELHMAQNVPAVRIRAFKNGEGSRGQGEILIGSSIHAVGTNMT